MKQLPAMALALAALGAAMGACSDSESTIGSSLITDQVEILVDSSFTVSGHAVEARRVQSRTTLQLLGRIDNQAYGSFSSDFVTQFMSAERINTDGVSADLIDSVKLTMRVPLGAYVGDSLMPMGIKVHPLTKSLPTPIYSTFNPAGYYDPSTTLASGFYTMTASDTDGSAGTSWRYINLRLPLSFGKKLFEKYLENPAIFSSPSAFTDFFPGMYVATSFGSGRVVQIDSTVVTVHYRKRTTLSEPDDDGNTYEDTPSKQTYMAVTPEVITNNNFAFAAAPAISQRAAAGEPILVAPVGYDVEVHFPVDEIISSYRSHGTELTVANTLSFTIPVEEIGAGIGLTPPPYVLMVKKDQKDEFFTQSRLPDNVSSFYAAYDSYNHRYVFSSLRGYLLDMLQQEGGPTEADMEFVIVPVTIGWENSASSTSSYYYYYSQYSSAVVATVTPYVQKPSMALLKLDDARIKFTFSVQNISL